MSGHSMSNHPCRKTMMSQNLLIFCKTKTPNVVENISMFGCDTSQRHAYSNFMEIGMGVLGRGDCHTFHGESGQ